MAEPIRIDPETFHGWQLDGVIEELLASAPVDREGKSARTLVKGPGLTVVLTVLRAGQSLEEHRAAAPVVVVPLRGEVIFRHGEQSSTVATDGRRALVMGPGQAHSVRAETDAAFLLVLGPRA